MLDSSRFAPIIQDMLDMNIIVGPALAGVGTGGLDDETYLVIENAAKTMTAEVWPKPGMLRNYPNAIIPPLLIQQGITETISCTAAYLSHLELGYLNVDEAMVRVAVRLIEKFLRDHTVDEVLTLNFMVDAYDDYQVLKYYGLVLEEKFLSGELHRPWIHYTLHDELAVVLQLGNVGVVSKDGARYISLTEAGITRYEAIRGLFKETGFLQRRASLMRLSQFSQLADYDELVESVGAMMAARMRLLELCGIREGMHVLELGCGTGGLTIDAGLYKKVGTTGTIVCTDPSFGMLARAKTKLQCIQGVNIKFQQSRAEELPFSSGTFDAVIGCNFLQYTDIPTTIMEIHRVLKPGGLFSAGYPLSFPHSLPFFADWFEPILSIATPEKKRDSMPESHTVPDSMGTLFGDVNMSGRKDSLRIIEFPRTWFGSLYR